jgi:hypothetical protein
MRAFLCFTLYLWRKPAFRTNLQPSSAEHIYIYTNKDVRPYKALQHVRENPFNPQDGSVD